MTKNKEWNRQFQGIGLKLEPQVIRVANDFVLDVYLQSDPRNCMRLADYIHHTYRMEYREKLKISARSLAIEIYAHYRVQKTVFRMQETVGKNPVFSRIIGHTEVIDCGSAEKDSNRFIWDILSDLSRTEQKIRQFGSEQSKCRRQILNKFRSITRRI